MVQHTRLDCVIGSASLMRQAVVQAIHHARHRQAFGRLLISQPLMQNVLADLCLESEAATVLMMRLARAFDTRERYAAEHGFARLGTAVAKYWISKRAPVQVNEALECLGGNGFVEESMMPRLFRQSPLNGVWEGSGNVICLDVLRALTREPDALEAYWSEVGLADRSDARLSAAVDQLRTDLSDPLTLEGRARSVVERMALVFQASLLIRSAPGAVADAFCASRLGGGGAGVFGTLPMGTDTTAILARHTPA
jgi:putative acyl-CoA dehydrogenase